MEQIEDGYFEIDARGQLCHANTVFRELFGLDSNGLEAVHLSELLSPDGAIGRKRFQRLTQGGCPVDPLKLDLQDGQGLSRKVVMTLAGRGGSQRPGCGWCGIVKDVTAKKKMAAGLARTKRFLQNIVNSSMEGIAAADLHNTLVYVSPRLVDMAGYAKTELLGESLIKLFRTGEYDLRLIERALMEEGTLRDHETQLLTAAGDPLDVNLSVSLLRDNSGDIQGKLIVCRDITESKRLESQLRFGQRMEAIGTLAGGIAHNFNNLLMGIQGNTTLMMLDVEPDNPNYKRIVNIEKHIQSGSRLTRQLIGYAREGKYQVQAMDLNHVIRETAEAFALSQTRTQIHFHLDPLLPGMLADRGQIEQVLMNLLMNAVDAMPDGGRITIGTRRLRHTELMGKPYQPAPGQYICLSVSDTGSGMDQDTRKRVFEPFFTTKGLDRGSGLGLASCYGIIKAHGGYIDVESDPGQGSCFTIYFPGTEQPVDPEFHENGRCLPGSETVLVVDDEPMILEVTREMLEQLGYRVLSAESGAQGIRIYQEQGAKIDMVILDMVMPEMGGDQTFEALRRLDPEIKVLLASGYSMEGKAAALLDQGCLGYIQKPFDLPSLSIKLREILETPRTGTQK